MNCLIINTDTNTEMLEIENCCEAIEYTVAQVSSGVKAEMYVYHNEIWFSWTNELGFIGPRPKTPPTRA